MTNINMHESQQKKTPTSKRIKVALFMMAVFVYILNANSKIVIGNNNIDREIYPLSDTYVRQYESFAVPTSVPADPVHNEQSLRVAHSDREPKNFIVLIKFDITNLPKDEEIIYAGLQLFVASSRFDVYPRYVSIFDVIQYWNEETVWMDGAPALGGTQECSMLPFVYQGDTMEFDITKLVSRWYTGKNNGLAIKYNNGRIVDKIGSTIFYSSESSTPPKLRVVMSGDLDRIVPTPTARLQDEICIPYIWNSVESQN